MKPVSLQNCGRPDARRLKILHIVLSTGETSAPYNEHCLPMADKRDITLCTYFKPTVVVPPEIRLFSGDGTLRGFMRALKSATQTDSYDVIHAHSPHVALLFLLSTPLRARALLRSAVVTVHDSYPNFKFRNRLLLLPVFAGFARVVCCGHASFNSFPALYRWLAGEGFREVQNGLDIARIDRIAAIRNRPRKGDLFKLVSVSRLVTIKNPSTVLSAFEAGQDPRSRLTYIGDGPLRQSLVAWSTQTGLDRLVTFKGLLPRNNVFEHMLTADLFISASRGEGLPIAVLEAMACGCPVLLSDIPPHREIAEHANFIPLVNPDNKSGFAREIEKFRRMSRSERAEIGSNCRRLVEQRFSLEAMHARYEAIYRSVSQQVKIRSPWATYSTHAR